MGKKGGRRNVAGAQKLILTYDEEEQRDYVLGLRKRKDERRKKAKEEKREAMKEMRRTLKKEKLDFVKDRVKKVKHLLPTNILNGDEEDSSTSTYPPPPPQQVVDYDDHTVVVTDLSAAAGFADRPSYRDTKMASIDSDEEEEKEEEEEDDDEEDDKDPSSKSNYSVDAYKRKSREICQKLQSIEGKSVNKKQMFLQRKQKKKIQRKMKRKGKK